MTRTCSVDCRYNASQRWSTLIFFRLAPKLWGSVRVPNALLCSLLALPGDLRRAWSALRAVLVLHFASAPALRAAGKHQEEVRHVQVLAAAGERLIKGGVVRIWWWWPHKWRHLSSVVRKHGAGDSPPRALGVHAGLARLVAHAAADHRRFAQHLVHHVFLLGR